MSAHFVRALVDNRNAIRRDAKDEILVRRAQDRLVSEEGRFNAFDADDKKVAGKLYERLTKDKELLTDAGAQQMLLTFAEKGIVPAPAAETLQQALASGDRESAARALQLAQRINLTNPRVLVTVKGGKDIQTAAQVFKNRVIDQGLTEAQATEAFFKDNDPEQRAQVKNLAPLTKEFLKKIDQGLVEDVFDPGFFTSGPGGGFTEAQTSNLIATYRDIFRREFETDGNSDRAFAAANEQIKIIYGQTELTGSRIIMRHPPESFVRPNDIPLLNQHFANFVQTHTEFDADPARAIIVSDDHTARTVRDFNKRKLHMALELDEDGKEVQTVKPVMPEWLVHVMREENGQQIIETLGYFSLDGLQQLRRDKTARKAQEIREGVIDEDRARDEAINFGLDFSERPSASLPTDGETRLPPNPDDDDFVPADANLFDPGTP